ncbi:hypothetical protein [Lichenibacterium dinghuense]|uniref:hypothetical protein n=1 Tax=Lichenibacterium dinghuense TaxID=2895977 RepID=UPI001F411C14|nr:hypothetical protein [Lichenibacterium sp. 6Y81]
MVRRRAARLAVLAPLCGSAMLVAGSGTARADANCMARLLADVPALEAPEQVKSKSSGTFGPLSAVKVDKRTGKMFYCSVNTYCYDSNAFQLTTPCRFKLDKSFGSSLNPYFVYSAR